MATIPDFTNLSMGPGQDLAPPPPPPGLTYIAAVKPALYLMLIAMSFTAIMLPLLIALFLFSTRELRRRPIFVLSVLIVLMGIVLGSLSIWCQVSEILHPGEVNRAIVPSAVFFTLTTLFAECVLFVRLIAVYPPATTSWPTRLVVYLPPTLLKLARLLNIVVFLKIASHKLDTMQNAQIAIEAVWRQPGTRVEIIMQVIDNSYVSLLFLLKLQQAIRLSSRPSVLGPTAYHKRVRTLIWIVLSNFILPDLLSLAQLIFLFADRNYYTGIFMSALFPINTFVEIIGVLFATVWASSNHWQSNPDSDCGEISTFEVRRVVHLQRSVTSSCSEMENRGNARPEEPGPGQDSEVALMEKAPALLVSSEEN